MTWLKKRLKFLDLARRGPAVHYSVVPRIQAAIECELQGCNSNVGYRQMWQILRNKYGLTVKRQTVQMMLAVIDPEGVARRKSRRLKRRVYQNKGPDFVWHLDGYDKLKPYGFTIHGCVDGVIWLKLGSTNNNPKVILLYYLLAVLKAKGCPTIVRSDKGTENSLLATCHMALRHSHGDAFCGERSFRYGPSTTNTRIEGWWSQLRKSLTDWWINLFKDLTQQGKFNPHSNVHRHALAFVYERLLEVSLEQFKLRWNSHRIRTNRTAGCPPGVPNDLYFLPDISGTESYKKCIASDVWVHCYTELAVKPHPLYPMDFSAAASAILTRDFNICQEDITLENAEPIYAHIVNEMSLIINT